MNVLKSLSFSSVENLLIRLVYSSKLLVEYNNHEVISDIIKVSQKNNQAHQIGGEIIWNSAKSNIIQILEGPSICVNKLYNKIKNDPRHTNINMIACDDITEEQKLYDVWDASVIKGISTGNYEPSVNDFEIKSIIGQGGFSTVVKSYNSVKNKYYAVKIISKKKMTRNMCMILLFPSAKSGKNYH